MSYRRLLIGLLVIFVCGPVRGEMAAEIAVCVDTHLSRLWQQVGVEPAPSADDSEFLRRVTLDLTGVVPTVADAREFLESQAPDKRARLIDKLLASPRHATHLANTWRNIILPDGFSVEMGDSAAGMQEWLRARFAENLRYDRLVGDFLTATGGSQTGPALYYQALESKPEKLAASTARIFLGLRLECAQCHDHPFDDWSQRDFWEYAAFFAQVAGENRGGSFRLSDRNSGEVHLPETTDIVSPQFPSGDAPGRDTDGSRRLQLSIWMSSPNNPFLPRAAVNRVWALLFGRGLVDPVDDLGTHNESVDPELLDKLSDLFVQANFDVRELYRGLVNSQAYQLTSRCKRPEIGDQRRPVFAQMHTKALTAEQLYDSIQQGLHVTGPAAASSNVVTDTERQTFVAQLETKAANATEYHAGIQQTLSLMNGGKVATGTGGHVGLLVALRAPFLSREDRLDAIYLSTLSRFPTPAERQPWTTPSSGDPQAEEEILGDLLWAILNSAEFRFNH